MERIDILKEVASGAGEILKRGFGSKKVVKHKGKVDLITQYDKESEEYILAQLSKALPEFTLVAEESYSGQSLTPNEIYIDPIDGTTNFVHGLPFFAVSIGLYIDGEADSAVVYNPILDEMFWALKGEGAWRNGDKISVSSESKFQSSLISTGFPYAKVEAGKEYLWSVESVASILPKIQDLRRFGSASLDLCFVADGRFEGFFEIGLMPWDVGAGVLIVQEAGGKISKTDGSNYSLGDFDIVASNGLIHQEFISSIKSWE